MPWQQGKCYIIPNNFNHVIIAVGIMILSHISVMIFGFQKYIEASHPRQQSSWGQHGAHLGPVGPRGAYVGPMNLAIRDIIWNHHWPMSSFLVVFVAYELTVGFFVMLHDTTGLGQHWFMLWLGA